MSVSLNPLVAAGADPELRFLSPALRLQQLSADPALASVLDPSTSGTRMVCLVFPVTEDEPAEQPQREGEEPTPADAPGPASETHH